MNWLTASTSTLSTYPGYSRPPPNFAPRFARASYDKWCGTVEVEAPQRVGQLSVWSSGEMDCQVLRGAD